MSLRALVFAAFLSGAVAHAQDDILTVRSPDGRIEFRLFDGPPWAYDLEFPHLAYQVDFKGKRLIDTSHLGFEIENALPLGHKPGLVTSLREEIRETYTAVAGKAKNVEVHANELIAQYLQNGSLGRLLNVEVRVFNDGVAFRYVVPPSPPLLEIRIPNEITEFHFARDGDSFPLFLNKQRADYAGNYVKLPLSAIPMDGVIGAPFLVEQPGVGWAAITEAFIDGYPGMHLMRTADGILQSRLAPRVDGSGLALIDKTPIASPWRVILIADAPETLIASNIVDSLNPPSTLRDTSWIQPGRLTASAAATTASVKSAIDFAAEAGFEYAEIAQDWALAGNGGAQDLLRPKQGLNLPDAIAYARQKKVGLWLRADWRSVESQMDRAFEQFESWGIRGVTVEGMNRDDQAMVAFYRSAASQAAEHHLMLAFHGAYKPDGMRRTFPNVLTRDAALDSEQFRWNARVSPDHDVMLAFTRLLVGPLDYAPGGFRNVTRAEFVPQEQQPMTLGTRAHQLALTVLFESPLQRIPGDAASYRSETGFEFLKAVPATWDATKVVAGEATEFVAVARSHVSDWYLGAITDWTPREIQVPLSFLGSGEYVAEIYADAPDAATNPKHVAVEQRRVNASGSLRLKLATGGGAAIRFRAAN